MPCLDGAPRTIARWFTCALIFTATFETLARVLVAAWAPLGIRPPMIQENALASSSVREFWGVRWNRSVGGWLREHVHAPLARRGAPERGVVAAFLASAAMHFYIAYAPLGWRWALVMTAFFLAQLVLIAVERALGVRRWAPWRARAWTICALLSTAPLFCEPVCRMFDPVAALLPPLARASSGGRRCACEAPPGQDRATREHLCAADAVGAMHQRPEGPDPQARRQARPAHRPVPSPSRGPSKVSRC